MFKTLTIASAILISGAGVAAGAAEVGVRLESGSSRRVITHGREASQYNVRVNSVEREVDYNAALGGGGGTLSDLSGGGGAGTFNRTRTVTRTMGRASGTSSNRFSGGSNSTFSTTAVFSN